MNRRIGLFAIVLCLFALMVVVSDCTKEDPTKPTEPQSVATHMARSAGTHYVYTAAQLDTLLSGGAGDGDTIWLAPDSTFDMDGKYYVISNTTLYFFGGTAGDPPIISRGQGVNPFLHLRNTTHNHDSDDVEMTNIRFESDDDGASLLNFANLRSAILTKLEFDLDEETIVLMGDDVTVDSCTFSSTAGYLIQLHNRAGASYDHIVKNSAFSQGIASGTAQCILADNDLVTGDLELNNNTFSTSTSGDEYYLRLALSNSSTTSQKTINLRLINNDFEDLKLTATHIANNGNYEVNIRYEGNNSDDEECAEDILDYSGSDVEFDWSIADWYYDTTEFMSYDEFCEDPEIAKAIVGSNVFYVEFICDSHWDNDDYLDVYLSHSDAADNCSDSTDVVMSNHGAVWNADRGTYVEQWYGSADVSGYTGSFDYLVRVELCDTTWSLSCTQFSLRDQGTGPPDWWPYR